MALLLQGLFPVRPSLAATSVVTSLSDQPSSIVVSTLANHTFRFILTEAWGEGETVTLTFPAGFSTGSIIEDDVDITDSGEDKTTAATCAGAEQLSVAMSGSVLTMTVCAGDGGGFVVSDLVTVEIGTNASSSGTGANQITNPGTALTYYVDLAGTSGNLGSIPIPMLSSSGSGVSGTVGSYVAPVPPPAGDPPTPPPPPPPPEPDPEPTPDPTPDPDPSPSPDPSPEPTPDPSPAPSPAPSPTPNQPDDSDGGDVPPVPLNASVTASVGGIPLSLESGAVSMVPGTAPVISVSVTDPTQVESVTIVIGDSTYILSQISPDTYQGLVQSPSANTVLNAVIQRKDGGSLVVPVAVQIGSFGLVYEIIDGEQRAVENAIITAYTGSRIVWNAGDFGQANPKRTSFSGGFGWYAPNGSYVLVVERDGYEQSSVTVGVSDHILTASIELRRLSEPEIPAVIETPSQPVVIPGLPPAVNEAVNSVSETFTVVSEAVTEVFASPEAQATATVAAPVAAAVTVTSTVVLASSFNLAAYLQYLITSPLLLLDRRKRKSYGIIYNAITKVPVELAVVRLYRASDNRLIKSAVANAEGKYFLFVPEPGVYSLKVAKAGYTFPSDYLKDVKDDGTFLDVYTSQLITVKDKDAIIAANIPMDPSQAEAHQGQARLRTKRFLRSLQKVIAPLGVVLSIFVFLTFPGVFSGVSLIVQTVSLAISVRLAWPKTPKGWGLVDEAAAKSPLGNVVVRLFEPRYNKLVESTLTDSRGRYSFLLGPNEYYVSYSKEGFAEKIVRPIDYRDKKEPTPLTVNVALDKA